MSQFPYAPQKSGETLARIALLDPSVSGNVALQGDDLAQAAMGVLVQAELLAAAAGVVPFVTLPGGIQGIIEVGKARSVIDKVSDVNLRTAYLASHGVARRAYVEATPAKAGTPILPGDSSLSFAGPFTDEGPQIGAIPVVAVVALTALAVAALYAEVWFATNALHTVEVSAGTLKEMQAIAILNKAADASIKATGKVDPAIVASVKDVATAEAAKTPSLATAILFGVPLVGAVAAGGYYAHKKGWL